MRSRDVPRLLIAIATAAILAGCMSGAKKPAPVVAPVAPAPPPAPLETRLGWVHRLEQQRTLRDASLTGADLEVLVRDGEAVVRRGAVIAIGRIGIAAGADALTAALQDPSEDVRAAAAFSLGLLGQPTSVGALTTALADPSGAVRARAIDGLGLIADPSAAPAISSAAAGCAPLIAPIPPDDEAWPKSPEIEICRAALFALVRVRQFDELAKVALDANGAPVSQWWPVAYALQRINDARAAPALLKLASVTSVNTAGFALRGLGTLKDGRLVPIAADLAARDEIDIKVRIAAVRALGQVKTAAATAPLLAIVNAERRPPLNLLMESVTALGASGMPAAFEPLLDLLNDPAPAVRSAALEAAARVDPDKFLLVLSGIARDRDWTVRRTLTEVLATFPGDRVAVGLDELTQDEDLRVRSAAMTALAAVKGETLTRRLFEAIDSPDFAIRATAAQLMGNAKPEGGVTKLAGAYARGDADGSYVARVSALEALSKYGSDEAKAVLRRALADRDWPVRLRAAEYLRTLGEPAAEPLRPATLRQPLDFFASPEFLSPKYSPHAFFETKLGTIEVELNVVDAPVTSHTFIELARAGFYNGLRIHRLVPTFVIQGGDPRGDGEGSPGYTIRDELSPIPFVRGTVGMAIDGRDTAGSQFFIALSPQPHLDGKYTVFGRVVNGFDVLDRISPWDVIERVKVWDGVRF